MYNKTPQKSQKHVPIVQQNLTTTILIEFEMFLVSNSIIGDTKDDLNENVLYLNVGKMLSKMQEKLIQKYLI